jgi:hypothetical protein
MFAEDGKEDIRMVAVAINQQSAISSNHQQSENSSK